MTSEQMQKLKDDWAKDPCRDIEDTEGFEQHREELRAFRSEKEREWDANRLERLKTEAQELGVDLQTAERAASLEVRADPEIAEAKKLLLHYMEMALPNLDPDCHMEIGAICEHIINAAKFETMRHIEINSAISRQREVDTPEIEL